MIDRRLSVAPMLDWTDRHCRFFHRQLTQNTLLYTEMVTTGALLHGNPARHLRFSHRERPLALQLGGSDPHELARCAKIGAQWEYDELNLNVGCPSDRVQSGRFGACLMAEPQLVADCVKAMQDAADIRVTVKHRIGIDDRESYGELVDFVGTIADAGCRTFIIHARKAWLSGLSPKENREIPPLQYETVHAVKRDFPQLEIIINGGIINLDQAEAAMPLVDGVMIGRAAYNEPWLLADADRRIFDGVNPVSDRMEAIESMIPYIEKELAGGSRLHHITRHMIGLFNGVPGARRWRRHLSEHGTGSKAGVDVLLQAAGYISAAERMNE